MNTYTCMLYGANGYTGQLIAELGDKYGIRPLLAGRNAAAMKDLGKKFNLPWLALDLDDTAALRHALTGVTVVIHAAGPFSSTAKQMVEACLETQTHYLDINGDVSVFEMIKRYGQAAAQKNIMLMPGVGFDVVPTDCLALFLKNKLPDASSLRLAFATLGGAISHGTAMTMASRIGEGGVVRKNGKLVRKPLGYKGRWIDFGLKNLFVMTIPWGDISTAYSSTGIPNIETYAGVSPNIYRVLKFQGLFNWLLRTRMMRKYIQKKIKARPAGPDQIMREKAISLIWGEVENDNGQKKTATLQGPEGYTLTAHSSLLIAKKVLQGDFKAGYQTPASCYGENLVLEIPGMSRNPN